MSEEVREYHPLSPTRFGLNAILFCASIFHAIRFVGEVTLSIFYMILNPLRFPLRRILHQCSYLAGGSLVQIILLNFMIGALIAAFTGSTLSLLNISIYVPKLLTLWMVRIMSPFTIAMIFLFRMAYFVLSKNPRSTSRYDVHDLQNVVVSRLITVILATPIMYIYAMSAGMLGGFLVGVFNFNIATPRFISEVQNTFTMFELMIGLIKTFILCIEIALISGYYHLTYYLNKPRSGRYMIVMIIVSIVVLILTDTLIELILA